MMGKASNTKARECDLEQAVNDAAYAFKLCENKKMREKNQILVYIKSAQLLRLLVHDIAAICNIFLEN